MQQGISEASSFSTGHDQCSPGAVSPEGFGIPESSSSEGGVKQVRGVVPGLFYPVLPWLSIEGDGRSAEGEGEGMQTVYVYLFPDSSTHVLDPYVRVTERDETCHIAVARVQADSLSQLVSLEEVREVWPVIPPVVRKVRPLNGKALVPSFEGPGELNLAKGKGAGIKVGIISDGVSSLSKVQAAGALPGDVHVLAPGDGDEGTAMLEIVHVIAPEAELYFYEAGGNKFEFNRAVDALLAEGCSIICDDIGWPDEPFFEDGIVASHVREALETRDLLYVSAAGNDANRHYQGMFFDEGSGWHDFSSGESDSKNIYVDIPSGGEVGIVLQWNDPWDRSGNNYDLYLKDCLSGEVLASSENSQNGKGSPLEYLRYENQGNAGRKGMVCVKKFSGDITVLELYIYPESTRDIYPDNLVAEDSVFGHPAVPGAICVGAVDSGDPGAPYIEPYSSRGPVSIYFPEYELRKKTDLSGPDNLKVKCLEEKGSLFAGTSASAPYVAGVAALIWSSNPEKNASEIRETLYSSTEDLGDAGYDYVFGYGLVGEQAGSQVSGQPEQAGNFSQGVKPSQETLSASTKRQAVHIPSHTLKIDEILKLYNIPSGISGAFAR